MPFPHRWPRHRSVLTLAALVLLLASLLHTLQHLPERETGGLIWPLLVTGLAGVVAVLAATREREAPPHAQAEARDAETTKSDITEPEPPQQVPPQEHPTPATGTGRRIGRRILLVEDSPTNQMIAALLLRGAGHRVDIANNGREALEALEAAACGRSPYGLVLMDLAMPEMDGLTATRRLRDLPPPIGTVPVIAMTADTMDSDRQRCLDAGMNGHVAKPIDRRQLLDTVARWMDAAPEETATPGRKDVLDLEVLHQLAQDLDADLLADVIHQFVEETLERAERIARGGADAATADLAGLAKEAHTLKSTAGTFGARDLSAAARALELACRSNAVGEVTSLCRDIPRLTREAVEAYRTRGYVTP